MNDIKICEGGAFRRKLALWATLFAGCGKAAFAFPCAVNGVVHSGMGSYTHFHDAILDS